MALVQGVCAGPTSFTAGPDFVDQDAICNCGCGPASANCDLGSNLTYAHSSPNCSDGAGGTSFSPAAGACTQTPQPGGSPARSVKFMGSAELPECVSNNLPATNPTPQLIEPRSACEIGSDGCGPGQACIPESTDPICFYDPDPQGAMCPVGYVEQHLYRQNEVIDSRDCTCQCGTSSGACGLVTFELFANQDCSDAGSTEVETIACWRDSANNPFAAVIAHAPANLTCASSPSHTGNLTPSGGLLVCCLP